MGFHERWSKISLFSLCIFLFVFKNFECKSEENFDKVTCGLFIKRFQTDVQIVGREKDLENGGNQNICSQRNVIWKIENKQRKKFLNYKEKKIQTHTIKQKKKKKDKKGIR